jgi:hypothetical protein
LLLAATIIFTGSSPSLAALAPAGKATPVTSTLDDQKSVCLTIYNVNLGLVKDLRQIKLPKGVGELRFMDVASQIIPASVHIKSLRAQARSR